MIVGEIVPQALCSREALYFGSQSVSLVWIILAVLSPIAYPISVALDFALGDEVGTIFTKDEMLAMMKLHLQHGVLDVQSAAAISGAIQYQQERCNKVMTPLDKVFMLEMNDQLDFPTISRIFKEGFSRIPVFDRLKDDGRGDVVGLLLTKDLILIDPDESISVRNMMQFFGRGVHTLVSRG